MSEEFDYFGRPYGMGRLFAPDKKDKKFPMKLFLPRSAPVMSRIWTPGNILDQGETSSCVGHAWSQWSLTEPISQNQQPDPFHIYHNAQKIDEFDGEEPDVFGTSVRAGVKVLQGMGYVESYVWAYSTEDIRRWILSRGPVVLGTQWYESMFRPTPAGFIEIKGDPSGGHAYLCNGYDDNVKAFQCINSWGEQWGQEGAFWIKEGDLQKLLRRNGEACAAIERIVIR